MTIYDGIGDVNPATCGFFSNTSVLDWSGVLSPSCWSSYMGGSIGPYMNAPQNAPSGSTGTGPLDSSNGDFLTNTTFGMSTSTLLLLGGIAVVVLLGKR